ncbi:MAG: hypothetical protein IPK71_29290 [Myxococcales bacterium]|nr:hypothetical protein [Myxococcales bacterium]
MRAGSAESTTGDPPGAPPGAVGVPKPTPGPGAIPPVFFISAANFRVRGEEGRELSVRGVELGEELGLLVREELDLLLDLRERLFAELFDDGFGEPLRDLAGELGVVRLERHDEALAVFPAEPDVLVAHLVDGGDDALRLDRALVEVELLDHLLEACAALHLLLELRLEPRGALGRALVLFADLEPCAERDDDLGPVDALRVHREHDGDDAADDEDDDRDDPVLGRAAGDRLRAVDPVAGRGLVHRGTARGGHSGHAAGHATWRAIGGERVRVCVHGRSRE